MRSKWKSGVFGPLALGFVAVGCASQFEQGASAYNAGRYTDAIASYEEAVRDDPGNEAAYRYLGMSLNAVGQHSRAVQVFTTALRLDLRDSVAHHNLGIAFHGLRQYEAALQEFTYTLRLNPGFFQAHYEIGEICAELRRPECAIVELTAYLQAAPRAPERRDYILKASDQVTRLSDELAQWKAEQARAAAEEQERLEAERQLLLAAAAERRARDAERIAQENERAEALRRAKLSERPRASSGSSDQEFTRQEQLVFAVVAAGSCEALRRDGKANGDQGDDWDKLLRFGENIGGMWCRDAAIEAALEKAFEELSARQRMLLKQVIAHVLEGDFKPSNFARDVAREELVAKIKTWAPELDGPAQFSNFLYDVYLQRKGD